MLRESEFYKNLDSYSAVAIAEGFNEEEVDEEEQLSAWQYLIDSGLCWSLQGSFGRAAQSLIEQGLCEVAVS
jgi:hypothetical protein